MSKTWTTLAFGAVLLLMLFGGPAGSRAQAPALPTCTLSDVQRAFAQMPPYRVSGMTSWVEAQPSVLTVSDEVFYVQGLNYYPMHFPWRRFLTETDLSEVDGELSLIASTGFNAIRIYLWNDALFTCPGSGAVPVPEAFARLDGVIQSAARNGLRVVMTLNDMPDLDSYPLYTNPPHVQSQTAFIIGRYRSEPAIMAWDMRNAGDLDYGSDNNFQGKFSRDSVIAWLNATRRLIRSIDSRHLITAGWAFDVEATIPYVDYISFAHWSEDPAQLQNRFASLDRVSDLPIVLSAFGFSSFERGDAAQADLLTRIVRAADDSNIAGWMLWTAFDFPLDATCVEPNCPSQDNREHHFGLWHTDYSPKDALASIAAG